MKIFRLRCEQRLNSDLETVFPFFEDPRNLQELTPPWMQFRIHDAERLQMRQGLIIDYSLRVRGLPLRWRSEILDYDPPHRFVDVQRRGPYRLWHHTHRFHDEGRTTRVVDEVRYATWGGRLVDAVLLRPELRRIFGYRQERLDEIFGNVDEPRLVFGDSALVDGSDRHHARTV